MAVNNRVFNDMKLRKMRRHQDIVVIMIIVLMMVQILRIWSLLKKSRIWQSSKSQILLKLKNWILQRPIFSSRIFLTLTLLYVYKKSYHSVNFLLFWIRTSYPYFILECDFQPADLGSNFFSIYNSETFLFLEVAAHGT